MKKVTFMFCFVLFLSTLVNFGQAADNDYVVVKQVTLNQKGEMDCGDDTSCFAYNYNGGFVSIILKEQNKVARTVEIGIVGSDPDRAMVIKDKARKIFLVSVVGKNQAAALTWRFPAEETENKWVVHKKNSENALRNDPPIFPKADSSWVVSGEESKIGLRLCLFIIEKAEFVHGGYIKIPISSNLVLNSSEGPVGATEILFSIDGAGMPRVTYQRTNKK